MFGIPEKDIAQAKKVALIIVPLVVVFIVVSVAVSFGSSSESTSQNEAPKEDPTPPPPPKPDMPLPQTYTVDAFIEKIGEKKIDLFPEDKDLDKLTSSLARCEFAQGVFGKTLEGQPISIRVASFQGSRNRESYINKIGKAASWVLTGDNLIVELPGFVLPAIVEPFAEKSKLAIEGRPAAPEILVTPSELSKEFRENEVAAKAKYGNKEALIAAEIVMIREGIMDEIYMQLDDPKEPSLIGALRCSFAENKKSQALALKAGQKVIARGKIKEMLIASILIGECSVVSIIEKK